MKRGQSALEFLMTYGWAILIILVMIAALVYFGVFNPSRLTPERCTATPGFGCNDYQINVGAAHFKVQNAKGDSLTMLNPGASYWAINASAPAVDCGCTTSVTDGNAWGSDVVVDIDCTGCAALNTAIGDKQKLVLHGFYTPKGGGFTKSMTVDLNAAVS